MTRETLLIREAPLMGFFPDGHSNTLTSYQKKLNVLLSIILSLGRRKVLGLQEKSHWSSGNLCKKDRALSPDIYLIAHKEY